MTSDYTVMPEKGWEPTEYLGSPALARDGLILRRHSPSGRHGWQLVVWGTDECLSVFRTKRIAMACADALVVEFGPRGVLWGTGGTRFIDILHAYRTETFKKRTIK